MLETVEIPAASPVGTVIWLHGLGADGHDFEPIVPALRLEGRLRLKFVFPHAPIRPVTLNGGARMRAWFDLGGDKLDIAGITAARAAVTELVEREAGTRVLLAGFSQGGALALATGLGYPKALAGIISLSAWLPDEFTVAHPAQQATPVFLAHGTHDTVIARRFGRATHDALQARGLAVEWHEYPMAHEVSAEEILDLRAFLFRAFA